MKRRWLTAWLAGLLLAGSPVEAFDLSRAPRSEDLAEIERIGWIAARDQLLADIDAAYRPATLTQPSSVSRPAFAAWIDLWRISSLLAMSEKEALARFFSNHLFRNASGKVNFRPQGIPFPSGATALSLTEVEQLVQSSPQLRRMLLPEEYSVGAGTIGDRAGTDLARVLLSNETLQRQLLDHLSEADCLPLVIDQLREIQKDAPDDLAKYPALAVALAIVWDTPPPDDWPHRQVKPAEVPKENIPTVRRFAYWVDAAKNNQVPADFKTWDADILKFVVDAPVAESELQWAQKNVRQSRVVFAKVFSSIPFDRERVLAAQFDWPHEAYTLEAIQKHGGLCVDQAYFAMIAGKAKGLPTLFFTGQGRDGGHAWFGFLKSANRWELDCGRYENQNYSVGEAIDPQDWMPVTDHELERMADESRGKGDLGSARRDLAIAKAQHLKGDRERALAAWQGAVRYAPDSWEVWEAKVDLLEESPIAEKKAFWEEAAKVFSNDRDVLARCRRELGELARAEGDELAVERQEKAIIRTNRNARSDLSVAAAAGLLQEALTANDPEEADKIHRRALHKLARTGGGDLFYQMTRPLVMYRLEKKDPREAKRVLDASRRALKPRSGSILDQEFDKLEMLTRLSLEKG